MSGHAGTQSIMLDLSQTAPRVFVDGVERACIVDITYRKESPLVVERVAVVVKP